MSATLQMVFSNAGNRNVTIAVADPDPAVTDLAVGAVMDSIISRNVFQTTGGDIIAKVRAQVVSRTVNTLAEF